MITNKNINLAAMEELFGSQNKNKNMQMRHTRCVEKVFEKDITSIATLVTQNLCYLQQNKCRYGINSKTKKLRFPERASN